MINSRLILILIISSALVHGEDRNDGPYGFSSQDGIYGPTSNLLKYKVVQDEVCNVPNHKMSVQYDTGYRVLQGNFIPTQALNDAPYIQVPDADSDELFTLMLLNPDYPTAYTPFFGADYIYWLVVNCPGTAINLGQTILPYITPSTGPNTGYHRYVFVLFKQVGPINVQVVPDRDYFSSFDFDRDYGMSTEAYAVNFFISSDDLGPQGQYWRKFDNEDDFELESSETDSEESDSQARGYTSAPIGGYPPTNNQQGIYGPSSNLIKYRLVGDVICNKPPHLIEITYPSGYKVLEGNYIPIPAASLAPVVYCPKAQPPYLYSIVLIGPDYPSPNNPMMFGYIHWVVTNIPGSAVDQGNTVLEYQGPVIPPNTGFHRHLFILFRQNSGPINVPPINRRNDFAVTYFARNYNLGYFAANFYISSYQGQSPSDLLESDV